MIRATCKQCGAHYFWPRRHRCPARTTATTTPRPKITIQFDRTPVWNPSDRTLKKGTP